MDNIYILALLLTKWFHCFRDWSISTLCFWFPWEQNDAFSFYWKLKAFTGFLSNTVAVSFTFVCSGVIFLIFKGRWDVSLWNGISMGWCIVFWSIIRNHLETIDLGCMILDIAGRTELKYENAYTLIFLQILQMHRHLLVQDVTSINNI